ncbi:hypothetical protein, partial [Salmonella sp. 16E108]|uniref:hypothetical protein n=1 Tax=Salmonella sp. 16E108 TaxID=2933332 RepID=UPI001FF2CE7E
VPPLSISTSLSAIMQPDILGALEVRFPEFRFEFATRYELQCDHEFLVFPAMGIVGPNDTVVLLPKIPEKILEEIGQLLAEFEAKPVRMLN